MEWKKGEQRISRTTREESVAQEFGKGPSGLGMNGRREAGFAT